MLDMTAAGSRLIRAPTSAERQLLTLARGIAFGAHAGQVDKAGEQYVGHCQRVAARLTDPLDQVVAWLHDVIEDTPVGIRTLHDAGIPGDLVAAVVVLTHSPGEPRSSYYARVRGSHRARRVKLADIADNSDPDRLAQLDDATRGRLTVKYAQAREALGG